MPLTSILDLNLPLTTLLPFLTRYLLQLGVSKNTRDKFGGTALEAAVHSQV
jgi:hypothetical protein